MYRMETSRRQGQLPGCTRRDFFRIGIGAVATLALPAAFARSHAAPERSLSLYNTHTAESLTTTYWADGLYVPEGLQEINAVMRDHRSGDIRDMDTGLLDLLFVLKTELCSNDSFQIISGYRSPATNKLLRSKSSGVAKSSYHMQGKAADIRLSGCELKDLKRAAIALKAGGVGTYHASNFIHVDVGPVRSW